MVGVMLGIYTAARMGLAAGITDDVERITGRQPITFAAFAHDTRNAWARELVGAQAGAPSQPRA